MEVRCGQTLLDEAEEGIQNRRQRRQVFQTNLVGRVSASCVEGQGQNSFACRAETCVPLCTKDIYPLPESQRWRCNLLHNQPGSETASRRKRHLQQAIARPESYCDRLMLSCHLIVLLSSLYEASRSEAAQINMLSSPKTLQNMCLFYDMQSHGCPL